MSQSHAPRRKTARGAAGPPSGARDQLAGPDATLWDQPTSEARVPSLGLTDEVMSGAIRDSLYDLIPLGNLELDLLATPAFTRLQGVKQLGFVYRVWPGATHTRFEHSLGVYYLMLRALRAVLATPASLQTHLRLGVDRACIQALLAAALLHDVGHYPFSHAIEELGYPVVPHERVGRGIIETGEVAAALERHGVSPQRVADLVDPPKDRPLPAADAALIRLLSGPLDVDKLDYLPRDARACNVPYGGVDVSRLLGALRLIETPEGARLCVGDKGVSPLNSLLHARQEMFDNVYWHHTNRAMMAMLLRATQEALLANALSGDDLAGHDDASLLAYLSGVAMPAATRALVEALRQRRPYKTALEVSARAGKIYSLLDTLFWDQSKRRRVEIALSEALSAEFGETVEPWDVLVDIPKPEKWEMDVLVQFDEPPLGMQPLISWTEATGQRPDDLGVYEKRQRRIRVVCHERWRDRIRSEGREAIIGVIERIPSL